ncbi:MAG: IS110 family transposase, partial [Anaerolineales bacterium]|nr:IS110 family transposase [Anaerolineales bacterium]
HPDLPTPVPLVLSKPLERQSLQAILHHCPDPHYFRTLDQVGIQAFFRQHIGRCGPITAGKAFSIVSQAVLPPPDVAALLAEQLQVEAQQYEALSQQLQQLEVEAEALVPHTPAAILTTIPGVSPFLAARYLGYLKAHRRFNTAAQIWAFAGFDPIIEESGDYRRVGKISRKGHPGLRDTLFLIGLHTARQIPAINRVRRRALARGMGHVGATLHAAHKANRLCHRLLYDQIPFDPHSLR